MSVYYNPTTKEYPRHPGDIQLIDPTWEEGKPLPEGWVEVDFQEPPSCEMNEIVEFDGLKLVKGVWKNQWSKRTLTQEEIDELQKNLDEQMAKLNLSRPAAPETNE